MFKMMLIAGCGGFVGTCGRYLVGNGVRACGTARFRWELSWLTS